MSEEDVKKEIKALVETSPRTVSEVHDKVGEQFNLTRSQVDYRLTTLAMDGECKWKKPREKASKIFYRKDYAKEEGGEE